MKAIKVLLGIVAIGFVIVSCSDTKDCSCVVEVPSKASMNKLQRTVPILDWDADCSDITSDDLEGGQILINPCKES